MINSCHASFSGAVMDSGSVANSWQDHPANFSKKYGRQKKSSATSVMSNNVQFFWKFNLKKFPPQKIWHIHLNLGH
jgi:hypothetical protein